MDTTFGGATGLVEDLRRWRGEVPGRAPSYHRLFEVLEALLSSPSDDGRALWTRLEEAWRSRTFRIFYERPLLLSAALRAQALERESADPLWRAIGARDPEPDSVTREAVLEAMEEESFWRSVRTRFVQTNETSRAVAWLWPAQLFGPLGAPLALFEIGCSAGLNLVADALPAPWVDARGAPLLEARRVPTVARVGLDARPLEVTRDEDARWLRACVWPGEQARLSRLDQAIDAFRREPATLVAADVTCVGRQLEALRRTLPPSARVLIFQTIVRDYLEPSARDEAQRQLETHLKQTPSGGAAWIELEIDHLRGGVPLVAHVKEGDEVVAIPLGQTGFHPTQVIADEAAVARFRALFSAAR